VEPAERLCARVLARVEASLRSIRALLEEEALGAPRGLLHALCLGVLRNYKLLEEALRFCGYRRRLRGSVAGWLPIVVAYEALFRRDSVPPSRLRYSLPREEQVVECLLSLDANDVVKRFTGVRRLAVAYSVPEWVVKVLAEANPPGGVEAVLEGFQQPTPMWIRYRRDLVGRDRVLSLLSSLGVEARHDPVLDDVVEVVSAEPGSIQGLDPAMFYVQDRSAALVAHVLGDGGSRVLDLFSAPGNKVAHVQWRRPRPAVAVELAPARARLERRLLRAQHVDALVDVVAGDARAPPLRGSYSAAIVDPDCSSIGRIGHSPETRLFLEKTGPSIVRKARKLQLAGLRRALELVEKGGIVVYSTCTLTVDENEGVIREVVDEGLAELEEAVPLIGVWSPILPKAQRIYPHTSRCAGGFVAKLVRV
jgi:16S rRNA (cytosine967-C5)-methyltransferase